MGHATVEGNNEHKFISALNRAEFFSSIVKLMKEGFHKTHEKSKRETQIS